MQPRLFASFGRPYGTRVGVCNFIPAFHAGLFSGSPSGRAKRLKDGFDQIRFISGQGSGLGLERRKLLADIWKCMPGAFSV